MSKVQMMRDFVSQGLTVAAKEIVELFERTIAEYEVELCRCKEHEERLEKLLDAVLNPEVRLNRADAHPILKSEEEVPPEQQTQSPSLDQEDLPEPPLIKEEREEVQTIQEEEQLQLPRNTELTLTPAPMKTAEHNEEKSPLQQQHTDQKIEKAFHCSTCGERYLWKRALLDHVRLHTLYTCSVCKRSFRHSRKLDRQMKVHSGEKPFTCPVCKRSFARRDNMVKHMRIYTAEESLTCLVCAKSFRYSGMLSRHMRVHTGEKPFTCPFCGKQFRYSNNVTQHLLAGHRGETI